MCALVWLVRVVFVDELEFESEAFVGSFESLASFLAVAVAVVIAAAVAAASAAVVVIIQSGSLMSSSCYSPP